MSDLQTKWENSRELFEETSKVKFDEWARDKAFASGPLVARQNKFMEEFGPYCPEQWVFGLLSDGTYVCCNITFGMGMNK